MSFLSGLKAAAAKCKTALKPLTNDEATLPGNTTLEKLQNLYTERRNGKLPPLQSRKLKPKQQIIAICLVIVDCLLHEDIWRDWINQSKESSLPYGARLFIQAKNPEAIQSEWVRDQLLPISFDPTWNSPEVLRAMLACLDAALEYQDEEKSRCERFVFATEYCIPILSLKQTGDIIFQQEKSWLDARHEPLDSWERSHCFLAVRQDMIPVDAVWKALPGWIMLTRRHAEEINALVKRLGGYDKTCETDVITAFGPGGTWADHQEGVYAPEEVFFATMLSLLGYLRDSTDEVDRKKAVYAEWEHKGTPHPKVFHALEKAQVEKMQKVGSILARKFPKGSIDVHSWRKLIMNIEEPNNDECTAQPAKRRKTIEVERSTGNVS